MRRKIVIWLIAATMIIAGSTALIMSSRQSVSIPDEGPWIATVADTSSIPAECAEDAAVDSTYQPAVMPPSGVTVAFTPVATRSDVERVLECLLDQVAASSIRVATAPAD